MTSDLGSARLGTAVRVNLKSFIAENASQPRHPCLGSALWLKTGISEVNSRMQKNLRLDWLLWAAGIFRPRFRLIASAYTTIVLHPIGPLENRQTALPCCLISPQLVSLASQFGQKDRRTLPGDAHASIAFATVVR